MKRLLSRLWGWLRALSVRAKVLIAVVLAALLGLVIWAVFFWFAFQTYFIDDKVEEAGPVFDSGAVADTATEEPATPAPEPSVADTPAPESPTPSPEADATAPVPATPAVGTMPGDDLSEELVAEMDEAMEELGMPEDDPVTETMPDMPQITVEASGSFINRSHPTQGQVEVLGDGSGQRFLRFEDFRTDNGPDLNVYLSTAPADAPAGQFTDDYVDLGDLKGNVGDQNYEIPRGLDLDRYSTVVIWCVRFSVAFGAATLAA